MTTTSTSTSSSTTGLSTTSIDVAGIVSQLMAIENKPLDAIKAQITVENVVISDLGSIASKTSTFKDALTAFQDPKSYNALSAAITGSDAMVVASPLATIGNYQITVNSSAKAAHYVDTGYSSASDVFSSGGGSTTLLINGTNKTIAGPTTVQEVADWINGLNLGLTAAVKTVNNSGAVALWVDGSVLGSGEDFTLTPSSANAARHNSYYSATDASITYNNTTFTEPSNTITDIIDGITINLTSSSPSGDPQIISVTHGADNSQSTINTLITSYNDLIKSYNSLTANANNSSTPGTFGNNPTMLSFINQIKSKFAAGGTYSNGTGSQSKISLSELGMDLQSDGTLVFNVSSYSNAKSAGRDIPTILSSNFQLGYVSANDNLHSYLDGIVGIVAGTGSLYQMASVEKTKLQQLTTKQNNLQDHLLTVQNDLTTKYSALNALLFQLSSTSNALTSVLNGITNTKTN